MTEPMQVPLPFQSLQEYWVDAWQRSRPVPRRAAPARQQLLSSRMPSTAPHVLTFEAELVLDGRTLPRPVNYAPGRASCRRPA